MPQLSSFVLDFRVPSNITELAPYLGLTESKLSSLLNPATRGGAFQIHGIPKHDGTRRVVWEAHGYVADAYKGFGRKFDLFLRDIEPRFPHASSYGFVRGRNTLENAQIHCGAKLLLKADITDFFPSITSDRLYAEFLKLGIQEHTALALAAFSTIDSFLAPGLSSSPLLANLVCLNLDDKLAELARAYNCRYTRYADDISISGNVALPSQDEVRAILASENFLLSERKFKITKVGQAHFVTGLSISDSKPHVPRHMKKRLRQELYYCQKFGIRDHLDWKEYLYQQRPINRIDGTIRYISHIEHETLTEIRERWKHLCERDDVSTNYEPLANLETGTYHFYIDESKFEFEGKIFLALGLCRTSSWAEIEVSANALLRSYLANPYSAGNKQAIEDEKLHFVKAHPSLRRDYVERMSSFEFRGYIIYCELKSDKDFKTKYLELLRAILPHRMMGSSESDVTFIFENHDELSQAELKECVDNVFNGLESNNNRRPAYLSTIVAGKDDYLCFSLPDFLLGCWGKYAKYNQAGTEIDKLFFEQLRDKCRVIIDYDNHKIFSRKRPFKPFLSRA